MQLAHSAILPHIADMFIQTEDTPNPATLKFLPGKDVVGPDGRVREYTRGDDIADAPMAEMLFMIPDVHRIFLAVIISRSRAAKTRSGNT